MVLYTYFAEKIWCIKQQISTDMFALFASLLLQYFG